MQKLCRDETRGKFPRLANKKKKEKCHADLHPPVAKLATRAACRTRVNTRRRLFCHQTAAHVFERDTSLRNTSGAFGEGNPLHVAAERGRKTGGAGLAPRPRSADGPLGFSPNFAKLSFENVENEIAKDDRCVDRHSSLIWKCLMSNFGQFAHLQPIAKVRQNGEATDRDLSLNLLGGPVI